MLTEAKAREALKTAEQKWGMHPLDWPIPPFKRQRRLLRIFAPDTNLKMLEDVFGPLDQDAFDRFWSQPGQSPYEDAGGAMLRKYEAMLGLPVETLPTYAEVISALSEPKP